ALAENGLPTMNTKPAMKVCCLAALVVLVFIGLGPGKWQPRTGLGWEFDHFFGYFLLTLMFCLAWPRPFVVGGAIVVFGVALEALQAFTPDRSSNLHAAIYGAAGALVAAFLAELFLRMWRRPAYKGKTASPVPDLPPSGA